MSNSSAYCAACGEPKPMCVCEDRASKTRDSLGEPGARRAGQEASPAPYAETPLSSDGDADARVQRSEQARGYDGVARTMPYRPRATDEHHSTDAASDTPRGAAAAEAEAEAAQVAHEVRRLSPSPRQRTSPSTMSTVSPSSPPKTKTSAPSASAAASKLGGHSPPCQRCRRAVYFNERVEGARGHTFHVQCYKCGQCGRRLDAMSVAERAGGAELYCQACYARRYGPSGFRAGSVAVRTDVAPERQPEQQQQQRQQRSERSEQRDRKTAHE